MFRQSQLRRGPVLIRQASRLLSSGASAQTTFNSNDVVILAATRTPIGTFNGSLSSLTAPQLGVIAVKDALKKAGVKPDEVDEALLGNVLPAGLGQAPARQVVLRSGLPPSVSCTTINKVCSSGMKSIMFAAQSIQTGYNKRVVLAGGFESMSNVPYYLTKARTGYGYGHQEMKDGVLMDGLWDAFDDHHMGNCAEVCADKYKISRQELDAYAIESYRRALQATKEGWFKDEITPVELPVKKGSKDMKTVTLDEQTGKLDANKVPTLKPVFKKDGVVTAANSSALNDGASAFVLTSGHYAAKNNLKPIARILGYADAERPPVEFTTAPADAIPKALRNAGIKKEDVDFFEINEAFAAVNLANYKLLGLDPAKCNVHGGAIALGHPIGASGARIVTTLLHVLKRRKARIGVAGICNGGGGASAIVVERAPDWQ